MSHDQELVGHFEEYVTSWLNQFPADHRALKELWNSMKYSLSGGGKRTRPVLGLRVAEALDTPRHYVLPWLTAIEIIHAYSLIHDDLPCMDNDDFRRGRPTNHKVHGEACALLAGDALQCEAFGLIAASYAKDSERGLRLVLLLAEAAGFRGMVGGQSIDFLSKIEDLSENELLALHGMKTGALFRVTCEGVALISGKSSATIEDFRAYGTSIGLCFQLADDLLDSAEHIEKGSLPARIGLAKTRERLNSECESALTHLKRAGIQSGPLVELVHWNQTRKV
ncbi:MAG: polyprenyl synthetase family protein [Bdellovibrio sp.]|nr:MAG: polyprenyl synthetase family protein [Bdellovibrio sp.]